MKLNRQRISIIHNTRVTNMTRKKISNAICHCQIPSQRYFQKMPLLSFRANNQCLHYPNKTGSFTDLFLFPLKKMCLVIDTNVTALSCHSIQLSAHLPYFGSTSGTTLSGRFSMHVTNLFPSHGPFQRFFNIENREFHRTG